MTTAVVVLSLTVLLLATTLVVGAAWARSQLRGLRGSGHQALVGHRVIANVTDGGAIRGVLTRVYADALVIAHPEYVGRSQPAGLGAEVTITRSRVPMLQRFDDTAAAAKAG